MYPNSGHINLFFPLARLNINIAQLYDPWVISQQEEYGNNINLIPSDTDSSHSTTLQPTAAPNTHLVEDLNRTGLLSMTTRKDNDTQSLC